MLIARDPKKVQDYVLEQDRKNPPEKQTVFKIRFLTSREQAEIENAVSMGSDGQAKLEYGTIKLSILRRGLMGWSNFKDEEGKDAPFERENGTGLVKESTIDRLYPAWQTEISNAITANNSISGDQEKNSESPSE